jgi:hypothetical protein
MKTATVSSPLITSGNIEGSVMGMDAQGVDLATYFLRDKIYSNKILAVVREYACNALDEHKKFNVDRPVEIGIRKEEGDSVFFCRDFARGLSEDHVRNVFGMYFRSTKSNSNNEIGGFGVGSKAGHCYTDCFFVASHFNGVKSTYTCVLGGGENGVPVGNIYKVDECSTNESGVEISLVIKRGEESKFNEEICNLVKLSNQRIVFENKVINSVTKPLENLWNKDLNGFNLRLVKTGDSYFPQNKRGFILQMGGITYNWDGFTSHYKIKENHALIIDVPIGKLSIPISREKIESTPSNDRVMKQINDSVATLWEEQANSMRDKNVEELVADAVSESSNLRHTYVEGEVFRFSGSELYPDVWSCVSKTVICNPSGVPETKKGKKVLLYVPINARNYGFWIDKVTEFAKNNNKSFLLTDYSGYYSSDQTKVDEFFVVKSARNLPYPSQPKGDPKYSVRTKHGYPKKITASELHNLICDALNLEHPKNIEEACEQATKHLKSSKNKNDIAKFTFSKNYSRYSDCEIFINSHLLANQLKEMGWVEFHSAEYNAILTEVNKIISENTAKNEASRFVSGNHIVFSQRTKDICAKNPQKAVRLYNVWKKINSESSIRAAIVGSIGNYQMKNVRRNQLRQILKIK